MVQRVPPIPEKCVRCGSIHGEVKLANQMGFSGIPAMWIRVCGNCGFCGWFYKDDSKPSTTYK